MRVAALPPGEDPDSLIRRQGPDAFRSLVGRAADYFDFALDEARAAGALDNASSKAALARKLAAFAASLPDAVAREAVASRLAPRLAISPQAFLASVPKKAPAADEPDDPVPPGDAPAEPDPGVRLLIHAALVDLEARGWLAAQDIGVLAGRPGEDLLRACLRATFDPADLAAGNAFMASLNADAQSLLASLMLSRPPSAPLAIAQQSLRNLRTSQLQTERDAVMAKLRQNGLPSEEIARLQAEVVDITARMRDIRGSL